MEQEMAGAVCDMKLHLLDVLAALQSGLVLLAGGEQRFRHPCQPSLWCGRPGRRHFMGNHGRHCHEPLWSANIRQRQALLLIALCSDIHVQIVTW